MMDSMATEARISKQEGSLSELEHSLREFQRQWLNVWDSFIGAWPYRTGSALRPSVPRKLDDRFQGEQPKEAKSQQQSMAEPAATGKPVAGEPAETESERRDARRRISAGSVKSTNAGRDANAVLAELRNRSYSVKHAAVQAMKASKKYRVPEAAPLLERIVNNQTIRRRNPGLRREAEAVLKQVRRETQKQPNGRRSRKGK